MLPSLERVTKRWYRRAMRKTCPECDVELRPVKVLDATHSLPKTGSRHVELAYAATDAKPTGFQKTIPKEGVLRAMLCPECGRTLLYAIPS